MTCADAAGASATDQYVLTVTNTNDAPTVANAILDASVAEDSVYTLDISNVFTDVDSSDSCTYTMSGGPSTIAISSSTITGTPVNADVGAHTITLTCTDGSNAAVSDEFVLTVINTNDAPTITSTAVLTATEDSLYTYTVTTADDDGETVTLTGTTVPSWMTFTASTGVLTGTPTNDQVGTHNVVITGSDGTATVTDTFTITVANTNDAPTVASAISDASTAEDASYSLDVSGTCTDVAVSYTHLTLPTKRIV